ncbi:hypothetical protein [Neolewinella antarctica]|uniref:Uncharacterized protein n=1 Tax=Neolewinella antarctica TaxID=442734 RepID=A0ABX0X9M8_9BACT|nr:hypothetical protein [Neolewinella antarctica]NJC25518.1 hypothetical protein [Neolewinella antarctica]
MTSRVLYQYPTGLPYPVATNPDPNNVTSSRGPGSLGHALREAARALNRGERVAIRGADDSSYVTLAETINHFAAGYRQLSELPNATKHGPWVGRALFGQYTFSETVGFWLETAVDPTTNLLSSFLSVDGFEFTPAEYLDLRDRLLRSLRKFERLPTVSKALEDLNSGIFRHHDLTESRDFVTRTVLAYLERGSKLQVAYRAAVNHYAHRAYFNARAEQTVASQEITRMEAELTRIEPLSFRKRRAPLNELLQRLNTLRSVHHHAPISKLTKPVIPYFANLLVEARTDILSTPSALKIMLREAAISLSPATVGGGAEDRNRLAGLSRDLDDYVRDLDEAGAYQLPLGQAQAATTPRQLYLLENILDRLRNTKRHFPEFTNFYNRRQFWYTQPVRLRRLMAALIDLPPDTWRPAFSTWYFDRCLERYLPPVSIPIVKPGAVGRLSSYEVEPSDTHDLVIDLAPDPEVKLPPGTLALASFTDVRAAHFAVADLPDPTLFFTQSFHCATAPDWRLVTTDVAIERLGFASSDRAVPTDFGAFASTVAGELYIYLPDEFCAEDQEILLQYWPEIFAGRTRIRVYNRWTDARVTEALLRDGVTAEFLAAILIRAAEAAGNPIYDAVELAAVGRELSQRLGIPLPDAHPLMQQIASLLAARLPGFRFGVHEPWRDTFLPLLATSTEYGKKIVLLPDGYLPGGADAGAELIRQEALRTAGFLLVNVDAYAIWGDPDSALEQLGEQLSELARGSLEN